MNKHILYLKENIILFLLLFLGAFLRVFNLANHSLSLSEGCAVLRATQPFKTIILEAIRTVPHIPLYEGLFLHFWMKINGSDFFIRLPSVIFSIVSLLLFYKIALRLVNRKIALISQALLVLSSIHIFYSRIAKEYSLMSMLSLLSVWFFIRLIKETKPRKNIWLSYFITTLLFVYSHYYAWLIVAFQNMFVLIYCKRYRGLFKNWIITQLTLFLLASIYLLFHLKFMLGLNEQVCFFASEFPLFLKAGYYLFNLTLGETVYPLNLTVVLPAIFIFSVLLMFGFVNILRNFKEKGVILLWFFIPFTSIFFLKATAIRYLLPIVPVFCLIISLGIDEFKAEKLRGITLAIIAVIFMYSNYNCYTLRQWHNPAQVAPWKEITSLVKKGYKKGDVILLPAWESHLFRRYFKPSSAEKIEYYASTSPFRDAYCLEDKSILVGMEKDLQILLPDLLQRYARIWLLLTYREKDFKEEEDWIKENMRVETEEGYQWEEHTLEGLKEGLRNIHKYSSYLYKISLLVKK